MAHFLWNHHVRFNEANWKICSYLYASISVSPHPFSTIFYHLLLLSSQDWHQWHTPSHKRLDLLHVQIHVVLVSQMRVKASNLCVWLFTTDKTLPKNISPSLLYFHPDAIMYVLKIKRIKHFCIAADISIVLVLLISYLLG